MASIDSQTKEAAEFARKTQEDIVASLDDHLDTLFRDKLDPLWIANPYQVTVEFFLEFSEELRDTQPRNLRNRMEEQFTNSDPKESFVAWARKNSESDNVIDEMKTLQNRMLDSFDSAFKSSVRCAERTKNQVMKKGFGKFINAVVADVLAAFDACISGLTDDKSRFLRKIDSEKSNNRALEPFGAVCAAEFDTLIRYVEEAKAEVQKKWEQLAFGKQKWGPLR